MDTVVINFKTKADLRQKAQETASEIGLNLSLVLNALLRQFVVDKRVVFERPEIPNAYLIKALKESEEDRKAERVSPSFDSVDDAIEWLKRNDGTKYAS